jgi:3D (Asp-Asp-Asp) domain-containing protein
VAAGTLSVGSALPGARAETARAATAPSLRSQAEALSRSESAAVLQLYAAESSLARARAALAQLDRRSAQLVQAEHDARQRAEIVRRSLVASRERVATLLRTLYVQGEADPIAVILGASSLDEVMAGIDGLTRSTALNERLGLEAANRAHRLALLRRSLADRRASLSTARSAARAGTQRLAEAAAGKRQTLASLRRQQSLTAQRLAALVLQAKAAEKRSAGLTSTPAVTSGTSAQTVTQGTAPSAPVPTPAPAPTGPRTLVVDAVAYHLPGNTASGLPVGVGVIAVDPTVIPLGTRLNVPGYGPAVAADVGTAVKGNIIDLWMPTTAQARAWGRRTVTITIYG